MTTVAIIYGGKSSEHEVSLVSASGVVRNINREKYNVELIGIATNGKWYKAPESELERIISDETATLKVYEEQKNLVTVVPAGGVNCFECNSKLIKADVVFPVVHGQFCEDGTLQGLLDICDIPYVGCGCMASGVTMDKEKTKAVWRDAGLPVVPSVLITRTELLDSKKYDQIFEGAIKQLGLPLFVKPCNAGSSVGASKASNPKEFSMALLEAFNYDNKVLIEKAINAREIECSVTGLSTCESEDNPVSVCKAYIPGEIVPNHEFYDYDAKYNDPEGAALKIPANLSEDEVKNIQDIAVKAYRAVDASGLSRVDFFIDKDNGAIYLNEINTLPGFTPISMFPKMCGASGLKYSDLIEYLLDEALLKYKFKMQLTTTK
ncbi:D-alanine--D-alanine ligase family protein [Treponema sp.]|uniref:D-alanine--D-alanine ligase family protein n=1 Tax=Treponema sp. TaxID=166 RepID=UPI00298E008E|nr:D-alanine--D-alanine ligase family protein [Treponema sp.]MCR5612858.1 D-alanine--D-alanine ligase [Treponema sp.]